MSLTHERFVDLHVACCVSRAPSLRYSQLQKLILSTNNIGEDGAKAMARWLPYSPNLKELSLDHNDIGEEGAIEIAKAPVVNGYSGVMIDHEGLRGVAGLYL